MQITLRQLLATITALAVLAALVGAKHCILAFAGGSLLLVGLIVRVIDQGRRGRTLVECLLLVSAAVVVVPAALAAVRGCGHKTLSLTFIVRDHEKRPIQDALVQLREASLISPGPPLAAWPGVEAATDSAGSVALTYRFPATEIEGLCEHTYFAFIPANYRVYVTASGFEPAGIWVRDRMGDKYDLLLRRPVEPIAIELSRTPKAPQGRPAK